MSVSASASGHPNPVLVISCPANAPSFKNPRAKLGTPLSGCGVLEAHGRGLTWDDARGAQHGVVKTGGVGAAAIKLVGELHVGERFMHEGRFYTVKSPPAKVDQGWTVSAEGDDGTAVGLSFPNGASAGVAI